MGSFFILGEEMKNLDDRYFMSRAIELAKNGIGATKTNPLVGCVIVRNEKIIGEGYHKVFGSCHAEVNAINDTKAKGENLDGVTLYVNLEPCSHFGKTPPCADRIIEERITRVVIGNCDPFEKVSGRGIERLRNAGIEVEVGVLKEECEKLNERYFTYIKNNRPFVVLKSGMTIDGKIATRTYESQWITSEESRKFSHELRGMCDGIMVGINTVLKDDPSLNVRAGRYPHSPARIIVDSRLRISPTAKVLSKDLENIAIIATTENCDREKFEILSKMENVNVVIVKEKNKMVDLRDLMEKLKTFNISSILLEGGGSLNASMLREKLVDKFYFFIAPKIIGSDGISAIGSMGIEKLDEAIDIKDVEVTKIATDILIKGRM